MKPPIPLSGEALKFWKRHALRLKKAGILSDRSEDSFVLLCQTWGMVQALSGIEPGADAFREMIQLNNLLKNYQSLAKQFGLLPRDAKQAKMDAPPPAKKAAGEFTF